MSIVFRCANAKCVANLSVDDMAAGARAECPICGYVCLVPGIANSTTVLAKVVEQDQEAQPINGTVPHEMNGGRDGTYGELAVEIKPLLRRNSVSVPIRRPVIEISGVTKFYHVGDEIIRALNGVSLKIERGELVALMGPSGSGKSTLMHILGCLDLPTSGQYRLDGEDVSRLSESGLAAVRSRQIGFVFQSFELLPRATVLKNVMVPLIYARARNREQRSLEAIERVGLMHRIHHRPNELSGGQRQRVAIARALAQEPTILLADEPTGNLDSRTGRELLDLFEKLNREGQTVLLVTHDPAVAAHCRRIIRLVDGEITSDDRTLRSRESAIGVRDMV
jgi:putative ABC transport system ATP-binding protein